MIEWIQSLEGIATITFGGLSIGSLIAATVGMIKSLNNAKTFGDISKAFVNAKDSVKKLEEEKTIAEAESKVEREINARVQEFNMKALSLIITQSTGISSIDKMDLITEFNDIKDNVVIKGKELVNELKNDFELAKKQLEEKTIETAKGVAEAAVEKTKSLIEKYSKNK